MVEIMSQLPWARILDATDATVLITDARAEDNPVVFASAAFERLTGYRRCDIVGRNPRLLQGGDCDQPALETLRTAIANRRSVVVTLRNYRKDGRPFWNELHLSPLFDERGDISHFIGVQHDVTARMEADLKLRRDHRELEQDALARTRDLMEANRRLEEEVAERERIAEVLRGSEDRFRDFAESASEWFWEMDSDLRFSYLSKSFASHTGLSPEGSLGKTRREVLLDRLPDLDPEIEGTFEDHFRALEAREPFRDLSFPGVTDQGERRVFRLSGKPVFDADGRFAGYRGSGTDITAMTRAEKTVRQSERRMRLMADALPVLISYIDKDLTYRFNNKAYADRTDIPREQLPGRHLREVLGKERFDEFKGYFDLALSGERVRFEYVSSIGGKRRISEANYIPDIGDDGSVAGFFSMIADITDRKHTEEALRAARDEAQRESATKSHFLAAASHDLRQPVHALELLSASLQDADSEEESRAIASDMGRAVRIMRDMLGALLDLSKLDAGAVEPDIDDFSMTETLDRMKSEFELTARQQGLDLRVVGSSATVRSDALLVERILGNFLSNAIRYTKAGRIVLGCRRCRDGLRVEVWDTGIGIPSDELDAIFGEYYRVQNSGRDRDRGLGLGLALASRLADLLGHELTVRSAVSKGSVFSVTLPYGSAAAEAEPSAAQLMAAGFLGRTIAVVEADAAMPAGASGLLAKWGASVLAGRDADEIAGRLKGSRARLDLIVVDQGTNLGSAAAAIGALRRHTAVDVPAIVLNGTDNAAGIAGRGLDNCRILAKPLDAAQLRPLVRKMLET